MRTQSLLACALLAGAQIATITVSGGAQEFFPAGPAVMPPAQEAPVQISAQQWQEVLQRLERAEWELNAARQWQANVETSGDELMIGFQPPSPTPPESGAAADLQSPAASRRVDAPPKPPNEKADPEFPKIKVTGFLHADVGWFGQDAPSVLSVGDLQDGAGFRRARLQAVGSVAEFTNYSIEMDFATPGRPSFMDVWLEQTHLPLFGNVRIGHFRQPATMDSYTPIRQLTFLERSLPFQAFDPFRRTGIMAYDNSESELTTWQYSVYRTGGFLNAPIGDSRFATDIGDVGGYSFATRLTHLLSYDECAEGRYLLHVGGNFNYGRNTGNDHLAETPFYQARAIPEFFVGDPSAVPAPGATAASVGTPFFADTGRLASSDFQIYGVELAAQYGSAHFQSEYVVTTVDQIGGPSLFYDGAYAQVGYFLTGEHRTYNRTFGAFDRIIPYEEFFSLDNLGVCGWGAWEIAARLSYVNLNDPDAAPLPGFAANPGRMTDSTLGLNWYWNAHAKLQFNWIHVWFDNVAVGDSDTDIYAARAQVEF